MNVEQLISTVTSLKELDVPKSRDLKLTSLDDVLAARILLQSQTLVLAKTAIGQRVPGGADSYEVSDTKLINHLPIKILGETYESAALVSLYFRRSLMHIDGYTQFIKDVIIMTKLAKTVNALGDINCKFTREILRLLNTRADHVIFREFKYDKNAYVYFLNNEYMVLTNRGIPDSPTDKDGVPNAQEFFVTVFRLGSAIDSYLAPNGFRGARPKVVQIAKLENYETTMREKNLSIDHGMIFNNWIGPGNRIHWFFKDGLKTRNSRLTISWLNASKNSMMSMEDVEWEVLRNSFGISNFNKFIDQPLG